MDVRMVERNPIVASLLADAIRRLDLLARWCNEEAVRERAARLSTSLQLTQGDGIQVAKQLSELERDERPDIIYLDPMFPARYVFVQGTVCGLKSLVSSSSFFFVVSFYGL